MYKIAALAAVAIIIIIAFTESQSSIISTNTIEKKISETNVLASRTSVRINDAVSLLEITGKLPVVSTPANSSLVNEDIHGVPVNQEGEKRSLARLIMRYYPNFETISFLLPNGDVYLVEPFSSQKNITVKNFAFRDYYKQVISTDKPYLSNAIRYNATGHTASAIAVPVHGASTSSGILGIWVGALDLKDISRALHDQIPSSELVVYFDQSGQRIVSSDEKLYSNLFNGRNFPSEPTAQNTTAFKNGIAGKFGYSVENINGMKMFVAYSPLQVLSTHWVILSIEPYDKLFLPSNYVRLEGYALSAVIGAAAILTIILLRRSFKSLNKLTSQLYYSNEGLVSKEKQLETAKLSLERKNEELDDLNKRLQEREKAQRDFINVAAHELRTPIVPILNLSELLYSKFKKYGEEGRGEKTILESGNRKVEEMVQVIVRNAYRLFHLTEDILDVTKIETQDLKIRPEELSLGHLLDSVVEDFRNNNIERKNIKIVFRNQADSIPIRLDKGRIVQVVTNLLNNALKFTPEGLIQVTLDYQKEKGEGDGVGDGLTGEGGEIEAKNKNENKVRNSALVVSVEDSGLGIDPEIYPKLFSKFATKSEEGTGLGLYISKKIVEAHGGKIWAENNKNGRGSTFYFTLPLQYGEESSR